MPLAAMGLVLTNHDSDAADIWRTVVICQGCFALGMGCIVCLKYTLEAVRHLPGRVPRRVMAVHMLAVVVMVFLAGYEVYERYDRPMTYRTPVAFVAFLLLDYSLYGILRAIMKDSGAGQ